MSEIIDLTTGNFGYGFSDDYKQGYSDGRASIVEKLEKIKAEIRERANECQDYQTCINGLMYTQTYINGLMYTYTIIDKYISELKGEENE